MACFIKIKDKIYNVDNIASIDAERIDNLILTIHFNNGSSVDVDGLEAIEAVMATKPSFFEGRRLKFPKRKWIMHNLVAHPLMQILAFVGLTKWGLWVHDATVPKPLGIKL